MFKGKKKWNFVAEEWVDATKIDGHIFLLVECLQKIEKVLYMCIGMDIDI